MELQIIQQKIYEIRNQKVILDFDLAALYEVENKRLKEAVRRNIDRFPSDFMFEITREEYKFLRTQFAALETGRGKYSKFNPFAFTEQGVAMLSSVLNSDKAIKMNIAIVRAFVAIRRIALWQSDLKEQLQEIQQRLLEHDVQLSGIYDSIENLLDAKADERKWEDREKIGFKK